MPCSSRGGDATTTGETFFFRDSTPFVALQQQLLPELLPKVRAQGRPLRIWCAACSTGHEPYSIAMIVDQMRSTLGGVRVEIVATDYAASRSPGPKKECTISSRCSADCRCSCW